MTQGIIKVLIVEDEALFRDMLRTSLATFPEIQVVGVASNGSQAVKMATELHPDVVLMDVELGSEPNGIKAGHKIRAVHPETGVVVLSMHRDRQYIANLPQDMAAGWSYLLKQSVADTRALVRAIQGSACGFVVIDSAVVSGLKPKANSALSRLTDRQLQVLQLMAQGYSNSGIAAELSISEKAVENYTNAIFHELDIIKEQPIHCRVKAVLTYLQESQSK